MASGGQPPDAGARRRPDRERPARRGGEAQFPAALRLPITLMQTAARAERDIAETLRELAGQSSGETAAHRLRLAEDATLGAQEAEKHSAYLEQLAGEWDEHTGVVQLHRLLAHAGQVLADLARTQQDIAVVFSRLAGQDDTAVAAERRQLAAAAAANARLARDQAQGLHELASSRAAGTCRPRPPGQGG